MCIIFNSYNKRMKLMDFNKIVITYHMCVQFGSVRVYYKNIFNTFISIAIHDTVNFFYRYAIQSAISKVLLSICMSVLHLLSLIASSATHLNYNRVHQYQTVSVILNSQHIVTLVFGDEITANDVMFAYAIYCYSFILILIVSVLFPSIAMTDSHSYFNLFTVFYQLMSLEYISITFFRMISKY